MATVSVSTDTNYSALSVADNDLVVVTSGAELTIEQTTDNILRLECSTFGKVIVQNSSTTTPIFLNIAHTSGTPRLRIEQAAEIEMQGDWITLGQTDFTDNQTFNPPTDANGDTYDTIGGVWVFPLVGGDPIQFMKVDSFDNTFGVEHVGNVFTHDVATNTITFGDGTNGFKPIPFGDVKIPNIQIKNSSQNTTIPLIDFNSTGKAVWDKVLISNFSMSMTGAGLIDWSFVGVADPTNNLVSMDTAALQIKLRNVIIGGGYYRANSGQGVDSIGLSVYDNRTGSDNSIFYQNTSGGQFINTTVVAPNRTGSSSRACLNIISPNVLVENMWAASKNNCIYISSGGSNVTIRNLNGTSIGKRGDSPVSNTCLVRFNGNLENGIAQNLRQYPLLADGGKSFLYPTYTGVAVTNCTLDDIEFETDTYTRTVHYDQGKNNRINNVTVKGRIVLQPIDLLFASDGFKASNIFYEDSQDGTTAQAEFATASQNDWVSSANGFGEATNATGADCTSHTFYTVDGSRASGTLVMKMVPDRDSGYLTIVNQTGFIIFNNNGRLYMLNSGDIIEQETRVHGGITGFTAATKAGSGGGNRFDIRFKMRTASGSYGAYQDFNIANVQSAFAALSGYNSDEGLQIKYELTKNLTSPSSYMQFINCDVTVDPAYRVPFILKETDLTLTGLQSNSEVRIFEAGTTTELSGVENSGTSFTYTFEFSSEIDVDIVIHHIDYQYIKLENITVGANGASIPIQQQFDRNYANP